MIDTIVVRVVATLRHGVALRLVLTGGGYKSLGCSVEILGCPWWLLWLLAGPGVRDAEDVEVGGEGGAGGAGGGPGGTAGVWEPVLAAGLHASPVFALLVLRQFLRTDHRGVVTLVAEWAELRRALGLSKVPHYSTLAHASRVRGSAPNPRRRRGWGDFRDAQAVVVRRARGCGLIDAAPVAAVDATGLETRHVSAYFGLRRGGKDHRQRAWPKLTAVVHTHSHVGSSASIPRGGAGGRPEPGLARLHSGHAAGGRAGSDRHGPG